MNILNITLPEFKEQAYRKEIGFISVSNEDLKGKWSVFCFYPGDFTFVCPTELADLQDHYATLKELGIQDVYSVSCDTHFVHKAWADATPTIGGIEYTMIGDTRAVLAKALGIYNENSGMAERGTFVFNPDGTLVIVEVNNSGIGRDAADLVRKIKAAKFVYEHPGTVCPAKWKEGDATLKPSIDLVGKI